MTFYLDLFNALLPSGVLVAAVWIAMRFFRLNAATRGAAWWGVVAMLLAMPVLIQVIERPRATSQPIIELSLPPTEAVQSTAVVETESPASVPAPAIASNTVSFADFVPAIYFGGLAVMLLRLFVDSLRVRRMLRSATASGIDAAPLFESLGMRRKVRVMVSNAVETPLAIGFFRPAILLPAALLDRLSDEELRHVLVHEMAHIARRDDWTNLAGKLVQAVCWPHPFILYAIQRIDAEREHACDDWVVTATGGAANSYARSLARLVELAMSRRQPLLAATVIGQGPRVSQRVEMLLDRTRNFTPRVSLMKFAMSLVCLAILGVICSQAPDMIALAKSNDDHFADEGEPQQPPTAPRAAQSPQAPRPSGPAPTSPASPPSPAQPAIPSTSPAEGKHGFLASLAAAGYKDLSVDEIIQLKNNGVDANYIRDMAENGWGKLSPGQLINLHNHGVSAEYLRELKGAGIRDLTLEKAIELRNHGVNAKTITEIHSLGFGPYDLREILEIANHGVRPSFFRGLKERGITQISARNVIDAASHGLTPQSIDEARKYGPNLSFEQILKLKRAGVI